MNYMESVTKAIVYIEAHLSDDIAVEDIAAGVGYSPYLY